ncbi:MAG: hypothetical protein EBS01_12735, partial [Verrucomicrobia bacterium]|nr:hypothetical protein [Verrucomicrobiota bacterium]
ELVALTGATGFCALLTRTLTLLQQENVLRLGIKRIRVDGSLERVEHVQMADQPEAPENDPVILPAQLLDLLAAFIGEPLTLRIVENIWPGLEIASLQTVHTKPTEAAQT